MKYKNDIQGYNIILHAAAENLITLFARIGLCRRKIN